MQPPRDKPQGAPAQLSSVDNLLRALRSKVSADKCRLRDDSFDLDLTYICDRIIAMSFPADGYEKAYRNDVDEVAAFLRSKHHHRFLIFNLSERPYDYSKFDNQHLLIAHIGKVQDWCGFPDHHAPPLSLLFTVVRQMHAWLSVDPLNVVVVHCLAGKGRTGLVIACFMVFCGLFPNAEEALNYFALKRSTTNWGVTGPSQRRYAQYFSDIVERSLVPTVRPLRIRGITLVTIPRFGLGFAGQGVCPIFEVWDVASPKKRLLYTSERPDSEPRSYPISMRSIHFALDCIVAADTFIVFKHITTFYGTEIMLRFNFHTSMINSGELVLKRHEIDEADSDKRYQPDFSVILQFADLTDEDRAKYRPTVDYDPALWGMRDRRDPAICWTGADAAEKTQQARMLASSKSKTAQKSGFLNKMGQRHKAWQRRWFVLKDGVLSYYIKPRDTTPKGRVPIESVWSVQPTEDPSMPFCFEIVTLKKTFLIASESKQDVSDWISSILYARHVILGGRPAQVGSVRVRVIEAMDVGPVPQDAQGFQCEVAVQEHKSTTSVMKPPLTWNQELAMPLSQEELNGEILLTLWLMRPGSASIYYGEVHVPVSSLQSEQAGTVKTLKLEKRRGCMHPITGRLAVSFNLALDLSMQATHPASAEEQQQQQMELRRSAGSIPVPSISPRPQASLSLSTVSTSPRPVVNLPMTASQPISVAMSPPPVSLSSSPNPRSWVLPQRPLPALPATAQASSHTSFATAHSIASLPHPTPAPAHSSVILSASPVTPLTGAYTHAAATASQSGLSSVSAPAMVASVDTAVAASTVSATTAGTPSAPLIVQSLPLVSPLTSIAPPPEPTAPVLPSDQLTSSLSALNTPGVRQSVTTENAISELAALSEELPRLADDVQEKNHLVQEKGHLRQSTAEDSAQSPPPTPESDGASKTEKKEERNPRTWHLPARSSSTGVIAPLPMLSRGSSTPVVNP